MSRTMAAALAAIAFAVAAPLAAQPGMGLIGRRQVSDAVDRDTIPVTGTALYGTLLICVDDAPLRFQEVVVRYKNGTSQNVRLRTLIAAGRCTREIELHGRRDIAGVEVTYQTASLGGQRARLQLFGR